MNIKQIGFFLLKSMGERRIQLEIITDESNLKKSGEDKGVGRKAEGGIYVNKLLMGKFSPVPFLY